jgi:hypothetical protein
MLTPHQVLPGMLKNVSVITESANTIFTFVRCQLPYPYVHLVSFAVHCYLFFWATYIGCLLHAGLPDAVSLSNLQFQVCCSPKISCQLQQSLMPQ